MSRSKVINKCNKRRGWPQRVGRIRFVWDIARENTIIYLFLQLMLAKISTCYTECVSNKQNMKRGKLNRYKYQTNTSRVNFTSLESVL